MIHHLRHGDIDKAWWDARITASVLPLWYARSAVLDAASPGWEALVNEANGAVMPLTRDRKWGFSYLYQPFAIQRLGVFAPTDDPTEVAAFLSAIPREYRLWDFLLHNAACTDHPEGVTISERSNMELALIGGIDALRTAYSDSHKRGLRKWTGEGEVESVSTGTFLNTLERSTQFKQWGITPKQVRTLRNLVHAGEASGAMEFLQLRRGLDLLAVGAFVTWGDRTIFLKGLTTEAGRGVFALHRLMDAAIAKASGSVSTFDMAGGHATELRRFYAGFGARPSLYLHAGLNRLPPLVRWIKQRKDGV